MEAKTVQLEQKIVQPRTYFFYRTSTTLRKLTGVAEKEVGDLLKEANRLGLESAGPMEFVYFDCSDDLDKPFTLDIALPVKTEATNYSQKYAFRTAGPFKCLSTNFYGDLKNIGKEYDAIFIEVIAKKIPVSNEVREVYLNYVEMAAPENVTEIQVGML